MVEEILLLLALNQIKLLEGIDARSSETGHEEKALELPRSVTEGYCQLEDYFLVV